MTGLPSDYSPAVCADVSPASRPARELPFVSPRPTRGSRRYPHAVPAIDDSCVPPSSLGSHCSFKPPPRPKSAPALIAIRRQPSVSPTLCSPTPLSLPRSDTPEVRSDAGQPPRPCPPRHTRGFVTSISALPNCCTPANHSSVRPGTQRSLRDTHRGQFQELRRRWQSRWKKSRLGTDYRAIAPHLLELSARCIGFSS